MIKFEKEITNYLNIPSIPKKEWDGISYFEECVGIAKTIDDALVFVVCSYKEGDSKPRPVKVFDLSIIKDIETVYIVPSYMDIDVNKMDLDDESMERANDLAMQVIEMEKETANEKLPDNPYFFDNIHSDDEATAFIKAYNKKNKIRGSVPKKYDAIVMRLGVIWREQNNK